MLVSGLEVSGTIWWEDDLNTLGFELLVYFLFFNYFYFYSDILAKMNSRAVIRKN